MSKKQKISPINLFDIESNKLIEFIKNGLKIIDFKIKVFKNKKSLFLNSLYRIQTGIFINSIFVYL